jgi:hypothetical protein
MAGSKCSAKETADFDEDFDWAYPANISPVLLEHPLRIATSPAERVTDRQPRFSIARILNEVPNGGSPPIALIAFRKLRSDTAGPQPRGHRTARSGGGD